MKTNEDIMATWHKGCTCKGFSTMPMFIDSTMDLTGDKFSISIHDLVSPECHKCGTPWRLE